MGRLPNVSAMLTAWGQDLTIKAVTESTTDFVVTRTVTTSVIKAVIQPTRPEDMRSEQVDWSLKHFTLHTPDAIVVGQFVVIAEHDYLVISVTDWSDYGYCEAVVEETRRAPEVSDG